MLKETLERFDEKFVDKQRGTVDLLKDEMPNGDFLRADYIKQFITEEIKLAREETIREVLELVRDLDIFGYPAITKEEYKEMLNDILNKLKKYETIRTI